MNIKKTLSAIMSLSIVLSSAAGLPLSNAVAADDGSAVITASEYAENNEYGVCGGHINIAPPEKLVYKIGEELDLKGGRINGNGSVAVIKDGEVMPGAVWDNFGKDLEISDLDVSEFDNTKTGIYKIKAKKLGDVVCGQIIDKDNVKYDSFYVMVVDGDPTEEDAAKIKELNEAEYYINGTISFKKPETIICPKNGKPDLKGCTISGSGSIMRAGSKGQPDVYVDSWSIDRPLTIEDIDIGYLHSDEVGKYIVPLRSITEINGYDIANDSTTKSDLITIEVVENDEAKSVTTAPVSDVTAEITTTTIANDKHKDYMVNEKDLVVKRVVNSTLFLEDGRKFQFNDSSDDIKSVKEGDTIEISGAFHYLAENGVYSACTGIFKITKPAATVTTAPNESEGTKKTVIYTGAHEYDFISVNTYPTQTVFTEGEEINTEGLNVKCRRHIPYDRLGLDPNEYEPEPVEDKDFAISPSYMTIIDEDGNGHPGSRFSQLPAGKYTVNVDNYSAYSNRYINQLLGAKISFNVEIKSGNSELLPERKSEDNSKNSFLQDRLYDQKFMGTAAYPTKKVYKTGEELDLTGLIIKAQYVIPYADMLMDASEYSEEPVYLKTLLPSTDIMKITDSNGKKHTASEFSKLPEGKYTVSCKSASEDWGFMRDVVTNIDLSFEVEISNADSKDIKSDKVSEVKGDANMDGEVALSDAVTIMQSLANPAKYNLTAQAKKNADIYGDNDGITNKDALQIQKIMLKLD